MSFMDKRKCIVLLIHTNNNLFIFILLLLSKYSFSIGKTAGGFIFYLIIKQPLILLKSKVVLTC